MVFRITNGKIHLTLQIRILKKYDFKSFLNVFVYTIDNKYKTEDPLTKWNYRSYWLLLEILLIDEKFNIIKLIDE